MKKIIGLVFLIISLNVFGQNPSNYQPRKVYERIQGGFMVDTSFHFPRYSSSPSGLRVGMSPNSGAGAIDTTNHIGFFYSGGKWRNFGSQGFETRLIHGGNVSWDSLLVFSVSPAVYYINGAYYTSDQTYLTLDAADGSNDRIDLIYLDSTGAHKTTGVPASTPQEPSLPANSIRLTAIYVPTSSTVPGNGVDTVTVYDENVEWVVSTTSLTAPSDDNTLPYHFNKDIQTGAITNASILKFTSSTDINAASFTTLRFYVKLKGTFAANTYFTVYFVKSGIKTCIPIEIKNGTYGFSRTNTTSYQQITIPISDFAFTSSVADGLWFQSSGSNSSGFYMDWVQLQGGITQPSPSVLINAYTRISDGTTSANAVGGDQIKFRTDNTMSATVMNNDPTHGDYVIHKVDTNAITTRLWHQKSIDSLGSLKLNKTDTANKWVNLIERTPGKDSIIFWIGSTRYAIKDSTGGGTPTLQQVTDAGNLTTRKIQATAMSTSTEGYYINIDSAGKIISSGYGGLMGINNSNKRVFIVNTIYGDAGTTAFYGTNNIELDSTGGVIFPNYGNNIFTDVPVNSPMLTSSGYLIDQSSSINLTEASATTFYSTTVSSNSIVGGEVLLTIEANDLTDYQSRTLRFIWSAVNKGGTLTITIGTPEEAVAVSAGTLTATITGVDAGSGVINFKANATSSLTQTTLRCRFRPLRNF